jgi:hypothetical protein
MSNIANNPNVNLTDTFEVWKNKINNINGTVNSMTSDVSDLIDTVNENAEKAYSDSINLVIALS